MIIVFSMALQSKRCDTFSLINIGCSYFNNCFVDSGKILIHVLSILMVMLQKATCKESAAKLFLKCCSHWKTVEFSKEFKILFVIEHFFGQNLAIFSPKMENDPPLQLSTEK